MKVQRPVIELGVPVGKFPGLRRLNENAIGPIMTTSAWEAIHVPNMERLPVPSFDVHDTSDTSALSAGFKGVSNISF